jgi:nitrite reductase/ring-hydroxylating ferredoxin subunit
MLSAQDNDILCRVGPGTPMGDLMRQYWIPALMPSELPSADCPPMRLRLLGENLIAFRVTSGGVGIIQNACPHRGASMFFGRNEEEGLRCVYHGWKFDVAGACVDMPSEPAESNFKNKVRTRAYPCIERNGVIWTYMGPRQTPPPLPELLPNLDERCRGGRRLLQCNYMQGLEGDIDTVHKGFLHAGHSTIDDLMPGSTEYYSTKYQYVYTASREHEVGTTYGAYRPAEEHNEYWRTGHFLLPFYTMNAPGILGKKTSVTAWVPADDENTWTFGMGLQQPSDPDIEGIGGIKNGWYRTDPLGRFDPYGAPQRYVQQAANRRQFLPESAEWIGKFKALANRDNDYLIDRELQAKGGEWTYTGVPAPAQDPMAQESMGPVYDRTQEHLATTDAMIIRTRRKLINAAKALREGGTIPPGVEKPGLYRMRSGGALLPTGANGLEVLKDVHFGRAETLDMAMLAPQIAASGGS